MIYETYPTKPVKCSDCGKFISPDDFNEPQNERAIVLYDEYTCEPIYTCINCSDEEG